MILPQDTPVGVPMKEYLGINDTVFRAGNLRQIVLIVYRILELQENWGLITGRKLNILIL